MAWKSSLFPVFTGAERTFLGLRTVEHLRVQCWKKSVRKRLKSTEKCVFQAQNRCTLQRTNGTLNVFFGANMDQGYSEITPRLHQDYIRVHLL